MEHGFCSRYIAQWTAHASAHRRGQLESPQSIHREGFRPHREQGGNSARTSGQAALRITALRVAATNTATSQLRSYPWRVNKRKSLPILLNRQSCTGYRCGGSPFGVFESTVFPDYFRKLPHAQSPPGHFDVFQMIKFKLLRTITHNTPMPGIRADIDHPKPRCPKIEKLGNLQLKILRSE